MADRRICCIRDLILLADIRMVTAFLQLMRVRQAGGHTEKLIREMAAH